MRTGLFIIFILLVHNVAAQPAMVPIAVEDAYNTFSDSSLTVAAPGLLENDHRTEDSLLVLLVTDPQFGEIMLNDDGSFTYTPDEGFVGLDEFAYMMETVPLQVLEVDTLMSLLNFDMKVTLPVLGSDSDDVEGRIGGNAALYASPEQGLLYDLKLEVIDSLSLDFRFGSPFTLARLFVDAAPESFMLNLSQRGAPSEMMDGFFTQAGNKIQVEGTVHLDGSGVISDEIPEEPQEFDTETEADIDIQLTFTDSTLTADMPVDLEEAFELSGVDVDMTVTGSLTAHGPLKMPQQSNIAQVLITVDPVSRTSLEEERPFSYTLSQNYPNPFNPTTTISFAIPSTEHVTLIVYDMLGREVATLVDEVQTPGRHEIQFDAGTLPSGLYVYRLETNNFRDTKTLILLK